jgi:threonine/homoserine/homoserine lactone efflux protein
MRAGSIGMKSLVGQLLTVLLFAGVIYLVWLLLRSLTH